MSIHPSLEFLWHKKRLRKFAHEGLHENTFMKYFFRVHEDDIIRCLLNLPDAPKDCTRNVFSISGLGYNAFLV